MHTPGHDFAELYARELDRLERELLAYRAEEALWETPGAVPNPAGNLALHLVGNLEYYVGVGLGRSGYVRDRDGEFGDRDVPRAELVRRVRACRERIADVLAGLDAEALDAPYPGDPPERMRGIGTRAFLLHLAWHLGWHLGQIRYHRLVVEEDAVRGG